jgi:tartrate-resistant acid phosphatase type 5
MSDELDRSRRSVRMLIGVSVLAALILGIALGMTVGVRAALKGARKLHRKGYWLLPKDLVPAEVTPRIAGSLRFLALGDVGTGDADQARVAATVHRLCAQQPHDFVLFLGDTFYQTGLESPNDPAFERLFESHYGDLGIPCYGVLGNHDVKRDGLPIVLCTLRSKTWRMPNFSYRLDVPFARFFMLNTNLNLLELMRLKRELKPDPARWTFVVGHHSLYANGAQGDWDWAGRHYWHRHMGHPADFYVCGHNHQLEHLRVAGESTDYVVSGAGGSHYREHVARNARFKQSRAETLFRHRDNGLVSFEVSATRVQVEYLDGQGNPLYAFERTR